ncbi:ANTAR domain-containing protein [Actinomadura sp. KC216]|uniref:GAF and ANTAR domain-containing protein n=1 Tax=Actinomadura sp. KC216 TaxID=2530370 RepID=UPI0010511324|nr:GAF and ANTAR domain-containing protein [Actinomadura sp. KC216]TDB71947.1 ANTAR domain-containing protein [Actinomadura sp. KC216]
MHIDNDALGASLDQLRKAPHQTDVAQALQHVVTSVDELFGYDGAGIMLIDEHERLLYVAASDEAGRTLEQAQARAEQGPCYDTYVTGHPVTTKDVRSDFRWPQLADVLDERVRAVAGIPIRLGGSPVGTLNVYRSEPAEWDDSDTAALAAYADLISDLLAAALSSQEHSTTAAQLQYALDYRVVIERAIGFLMATEKVDAITAFNRLRKNARDSRRRVADLAAEILDEAGP